MKTRVALLRGASLNDAELVSYLPLVDDFDFSFYHNAWRPLPLRVSKVKDCSLWYSDDLIRLLLPERLRTRVQLELFGTMDVPLRLQSVCAGHQIVHTAETFTGYTQRAVQLKQEYGHKVVTTVWENIPFQYENISHRQRGWKLGTKKRVACAGIDHFLVPAESARIALELEGVPPERISYIGNAVDLQQFQPRPKSYRLHQQLGIPQHAMIILFVGRLVWEKGVFDLLEAFGLLWRTGRMEADTHLVYAGDPREQVNLEKERDRLGLTGRVHFQIGKVYANADTMPTLFNDADIMVLPSVPLPYWMEQFGVVLIEAMASGIPVIGSSSGAIPEVIGEAGLIFPTHDIQALAHCLERLLASRTLRDELSRKGRLRTENMFSPKAVSGRIRAVYEQVLGDTNHD